VKNNNQSVDQTAKGGVLGIVVYLCVKYNVDAALTAMAMPLVAAGLSWASTKIGDPTVASFIGSKTSQGKPLTVKKAVKKKVGVK
jgi:hypothetical protein